jgi:hydrogenase/urease accessory protein HupE
MRHVLLVLALFVATTTHAFGHEARPAYLELRQTAPETWDVLWKVPGQGEDLRLGIYVDLPAPCVKLGERRATMANSAYTERWTVRCAGGLAGGTVHVVGLAATLTDVLMRVESLNGTTQVTRLTPAVPSGIVEATPSVFEVARTYFALGVEHILTGVDHLLFVLALLILVKGTGRLVATVTAFTVAHSITLAGATLGFLQAPGPPIEAVIALSIVFIAAEIVHGRQGRPGLTERFPWIVAFTFGLLHGFGFAGALSEVGLPRAAIPAALLFFNLGVEAGQLAFVALILSILRVARLVGHRNGMTGPVWAWRLPPYAIGGIASFWLIQRIVNL